MVCEAVVFGVGAGPVGILLAGVGDVSEAVVPVAAGWRCVVCDNEPHGCASDWQSLGAPVQGNRARSTTAASHDGDGVRDGCSTAMMAAHDEGGGDEEEGYGGDVSGGAGDEHMGGDEVTMLLAATTHDM